MYIVSGTILAADASGQIGPGAGAVLCVFLGIFLFWDGKKKGSSSKARKGSATGLIAAGLIIAFLGGGSGSSSTPSTPTHTNTKPAVTTTTTHKPPAPSSTSCKLICFHN